jgi:deazaflavin-dependent oxidoreductase (nitroreductase family)
VDEVADLYPRCSGPGGLERERPGQVSRHVVVAERGQQYRTGSFGARAEFLEHLADERRFTAGIQVDRARIHRHSHHGPADLHERSRSRHEHVTGPDEVPQRPGFVRRRDRRLQFGPVACLREPGDALLETTGRRTGQARRTPVCDGLDGDTFWLVAQRGHGADWVRNIEANPSVRVKFRSGSGIGWRAGTAHILDEDDPLERQRLLAQAGLMRRWCVRASAAMGTSPLTVRIDLDTR